ncbi:hypothetical protein F2Q69_00023808 [Brassica cretica]|uniref:Uncharacterized protein n=1 Tax=Brassica cretica TaxID=69181 RepID=A0A8S9Q8L1_BRACR|nr:hypothetical protein F2Q69_00023808 [Brassica cretica]
MKTVDLELEKMPKAETSFTKNEIGPQDIIPATVSEPIRAVPPQPTSQNGTTSGSNIFAYVSPRATLQFGTLPSGVLPGSSRSNEVSSSSAHELSRSPLPLVTSSSPTTVQFGDVSHPTVNTNSVGNDPETIKSEHPGTDKIDFTVEKVLVPHHDALVISLTIANCLVKRILVDSGSSCNIIFQAAYQGLGPEENALIRRVKPLIVFSGEIKRTTGETILPTYAEGGLGSPYIVVYRSVGVDGSLPYSEIWKVLLIGNLPFLGAGGGSWNRYWGTRYWGS